MTDSHPVFRFVWRVNALLILGAAVLIFCFLAYNLARDLMRSRVAYRAPDRGIETPLPQPEGAAQPREVLHVGQFARAHGQIFHAPLYVGRVGDAFKYVSSVKGGGERIRNVMMFDAATGAVTRLFPDDTGRILDEDVIERRAADWPASRILARVYVYVAEDTNGDGRLDSGDRQRIVVTRPDGSGPVLLAEGVDRYAPASSIQGDASSLAYFLRRGGELQYGEFDLDSFQPRRTVPVAVPKS